MSTPASSIGTTLYSVPQEPAPSSSTPVSDAEIDQRSSHQTGRSSSSSFVSHVGVAQYSIQQVDANSLSFPLGYVVAERDVRPPGVTQSSLDPIPHAGIYYITVYPFFLV